MLSNATTMPFIYNIVWCGGAIIQINFLLTIYVYVLVVGK